LTIPDVGDYIGGRREELMYQIILKRSPSHRTERITGFETLTDAALGLHRIFAGGDGLPVPYSAEARILDASTGFYAGPPFRRADLWTPSTPADDGWRSASQG
jgi:hypothetical protein